MTKRINSTKLVALLAALCLMTSAFVGSTLARYTVSGSGEDHARVAKFGVNLTVANGGSFSTNYTDTANGLTVESSDTDNLVAPGTSGNAIKFAISGKPEVATKVSIDMTVNNDVIVPAGTYLDWTTANSDTDEFTLTDNYTPVKFTLKQTKDASGSVDIPVAAGTLSDIETALEAWASTATFKPNTDLTAEFELTWAWNFNDDDLGTGITANNQADTLLGNKAAGIASDSAVNTNIDYTIKFTVDQVD